MIKVELTVEQAAAVMQLLLAEQNSTVLNMLLPVLIELEKPLTLLMMV